MLMMGKPEDTQPTFTLLKKVELIRAVIGLPLTLYELRVLITIVSYINQRDGVAYPPRRLIGAMTNMHQRHVSRAVRALCDRGLIIIAVAGTARRSARYAVNVGAILTATGASRGTVEPSFRGATEVPLQVLQRYPDRDHSSASVGTADAPPEAPEVQGSASEVQTKRATELHVRASRAPAGSPEARPPPRSSREQGGRVVEVKNPWRGKYAAETGR